MPSRLLVNDLEQQLPLSSELVLIPLLVSQDEMTPIDYLTPQAKTYRIEEIPCDQLSVEGDADKLLIPCAHFHKGDFQCGSRYTVVDVCVCVWIRACERLGSRARKEGVCA